MSDVPMARTKRTSYENFVAECPLCRSENIFNRASDLGTFAPIASRVVSCQRAECGKDFHISGDSVNCPHEMLIYDCYELLKGKHYMNCILSLAQAYEIFIRLFLRVEFLYRPFAADPHRKPAALNRLSEELHKKIKDHTFARMRSLFLSHVVTGRSPKNLTEATAVVASLPARPGDPKDAAIASLPDPKLVQLLKLLKATGIHKLRNRIVHKDAYRPSRQEAEAALKEARAILFPLTIHLQIKNDFNWYMREP